MSNSSSKQQQVTRKTSRKRRLQADAPTVDVSLARLWFREEDEED